jgi:hypothetical protein
MPMFRLNVLDQSVRTVPDVETGSCLDPGKNGTSLEGGSKAGLGLPERGKNSQLKSSTDRDNMNKEEEQEPIRK